MPNIVKRLSSLATAASDVDVLDCLVVGAGPAGLSAGIYLARYLRSALVVDGGNQRAALIPTSHNYPAFLQGVHGQDLLRHMRAQAMQYGARLELGRVLNLQKNDGIFSAVVNGRIVRARNVLLATGVVNRSPFALDQATHDLGVAQRLIRYCPICDGYEAQGLRVAIIGSSDHGIAEALFIRNYTRALSIIPDQSFGLNSKAQKLCSDLGITIYRAPLTDVRLGPGVINLTLGGTSAVEFDVMYPALGSTMNTELATPLGVSLGTDGAILTDSHQQTNVPGLYAAGDVVEGLDQIVVAQAQAAVATTAIHNSLRPTEEQFEGLPIKDGTKNW